MGAATGLFGGGLFTSGIASATSPALPSAPPQVVATQGQNGTQVAWTVGPDGGSPITSFVITAYDDGVAGLPLTVPAGTTSSTLSPTPGASDFYNLTNLTPTADELTYTVSQTNAVGPGPESGPSNQVQVSNAPTLNYPPYDVTAVPASTYGVTIQWRVGGSNGIPITGFSVSSPECGESALEYPSGAAGSPLDPTSGAADSVTLTAIPAGTTCSFTVGEYSSTALSSYEATQSVASNTITVPTPSQALVSITVGTLNEATQSFDFGSTTLGDISTANTIPGVLLDVQNDGGIPAQLNGYVVGGADPNDFILFSSSLDDDTCFRQTLPVGGSCILYSEFAPGAAGPRSATVTPVGNFAPPTPVTLTGTGTVGYYMTTSAGLTVPFGDARLGSPDYSASSRTSSNVPGAPVVGMASDGYADGAWLVTSKGQVITEGSAPYFGEITTALNKPIVGMASTPDGGGYWLVASDGGIFTFGDAPFSGSTGALHLNKPIVGMASTPDGGGYWLVASDGGIFTFGDAPYLGSTGAIRLNQPIVGMASTPDGGGYWLVASDGGIFTFGDAPYLGSGGAYHYTTVVGIALSGSATLQATLDEPAVRSVPLSAAHRALQQ